MHKVVLLTQEETPKTDNGREVGRVHERIGFKAPHKDSDLVDLVVRHSMHVLVLTKHSRDLVEESEIPELGVLPIGGDSSKLSLKIMRTWMSLEENVDQKLAQYRLLRYLQCLSRRYKVPMVSIRR